MRKIKNLNDLRLAKLELKAEIIQREMSLEMEWNELKRLDFGSGTDLLKSRSAKELLSTNTPAILESLSNLFIDQVIKPDSELTRKLYKQVSQFLIMQAEPYIEEKLS